MAKKPERRLTSYVCHISRNGGTGERCFRTLAEAEAFAEREARVPLTMIMIHEQTYLCTWTANGRTDIA